MEKLLKVLALSLIVGLFGVVAVSSILASPSSVETPQGTIKFDAITGIRWNPTSIDASTGAFDVYDTTGIAYIAKGKYIDQGGHVWDTMRTDDYVLADGNAKYKILNDISYVAPTIAELSDFLAQRRTFGTGTIYGNSKTLSNFPIVNGALLFESNAGTISNLKIQNPVYNSSSNNVGLIAKANSGTIENCTINTSANPLNVGSVGIGVIAYSNTGTVRNNTNNLSIISSGTYAAGIVATSNGGTVSGNTNNGTINSDSVYSTHAAGILAYSNDAVQVTSNTNNAPSIVGNETACGILASNPPYTATANISNNTNTTQLANIIAKAANGETAEIYIESGDLAGSGTLADPYQPPEATSDYGIYYFKDENIFLITTAKGLSYIGTDTLFNNKGEIGTGEIFGAATAASEYYITNNIAWSSDSGFKPRQLNSGGLVDGQGFNLTNFPLSGGSTLFTTINIGAKVKNINVTTSSTSAGSTNTGILCVTNKGLVENCTTNGSGVFATGHIGGIAYLAGEGGTFIGCTNYVKITAVGEKKNIGGIVAHAYMEVAIINCTNDVRATLTLQDKLATVGGIVGTATLARGSFYHPYLFGETREAPGTILEGCSNLANITLIFEGDSSGVEFLVGVGGLVGKFSDGLSSVNNYGLYVVDCFVGSSTTPIKFLILANKIGVGGFFGLINPLFSTGDGNTLVLASVTGGGIFMTSQIYGNIYLGSVVGISCNAGYGGASAPFARVAVSGVGFTYPSEYPFYGLQSDW